MRVWKIAEVKRKPWDPSPVYKQKEVVSFQKAAGTDSRIDGEWTEANCLSHRPKKYLVGYKRLEKWYRALAGALATGQGLCFLPPTNDGLCVCCINYFSSKTPSVLTDWSAVRM